MVVPASVQDAILRMSEVTSYGNLEETLNACLQLVLYNVTDVIVYVLSTGGSGSGGMGDQKELISSSRGSLHTLPHEGLVWETVKQRRRQTVDGLDPTDPVFGLLSSAGSSAKSRRKGRRLCCGLGGVTSAMSSRKLRRPNVVCSLVIDAPRSQAIESIHANIVCVYAEYDDQCRQHGVSVVGVVCDRLQPEDNEHLSFLEQQFLTCYRRLASAPGTPNCRSFVPLLGALGENGWRCDLKGGGGGGVGGDGGGDKRDEGVICQSLSSGCQQRLTRQDLAVLSLCASLYDLDAVFLQLKVLQFLVEQTCSESGFLLLIDAERHELFCQVIGTTVLDEEIRLSLNNEVLSSVVANKRSINLDTLNSCDFYSLHQHLPHDIRASIFIPVICRVTNEVMAIACLVNKRDKTRFTECDELTVAHCFTYTAAVLHSTIAVQNERRLKNQTQVLLQVATNLFTHLEDLTTLLGEIMQEARNLTKAERCSVFLLDKETNELIAKVFDGDVREQKDNADVRMPASRGIAGHVATTGELLNIDDTYAHPLFYRGIDEATGFRTRNILCFPIKDDKGQVIGVAQLCNKINGVRFSKFDEDIAQAFSVFCCISIVHSLMYKKVRDIQHRSKLSNELMIYHMQVANEDVRALAMTPISPVDSFQINLQQFSSIPRNISVETTLLAVISMLDDLGFITRHRIRSDSLAQFVLMVKKGYRDPPYHNWQHAFAVVHFCYLIYKNTNVLNLLDDVESLALFVACMCHDIDHRGTTNSFQVASRTFQRHNLLLESRGSVLAALYSSEGSVLERHHFAQTMCILNTDGCNIFENLSRENYMRVLDLMREIILATDLAQHLRKLKDLDRMTLEGFDRTNAEHRSLMLGLLMTACDLSDQTKNFTNSKIIAERIYTEFFSQGDLEKDIGRDPLEMMDREKAVIPDLQIVFLDSVALPVYRMLAHILPETTEVLEAVENNRQKWSSVNSRLLKLQLPRNMDMFKTIQSFDDL